ncbi:hypothetical protein [Pseudochryseolinea flava]|uniref:Lipoprotein n=1 Tax=Pseudochryseolinea flava TaxID=2059302 RepID=A0A364Y4R2_9BACT|nr:hypothetical protein [Pseudochryseolinea flava]RAW01877.1 hypothetical protein DQQ10_09560 [Pseudochryseolinea flava]
MRPLLKLLIFSFSAFFLAGCDWFTDDDDDDKDIAPPPAGYSLGKIYDYDMTECGCCGGYMIEINKANYKFDNEDVAEPNSLNVIDIKFPAYVYVKWTLKTGGCSERILIDDLQMATIR